MQTEMEDSFAWEEASIAEGNAVIEDSPSSSNDFVDNVGIQVDLAGPTA